MRVWRLVSTTLLLLALPAAAFVLVPTRGPRSPQVLVPAATATSEAQADNAGNVIIADSTGITATNPKGDACWHVAAPESYRCDGIRLAGDRVLTRLTSPAHAASLVVLALRLTDGGELWRQEIAGDVGTSSWHVARSTDGAVVGTVAVVANDVLTVLRLANGAVLGRTPLGKTVGPPLWVEDSGFVLVADDQGTNAVLGFDAAEPGPEQPPFIVTRWRLPGGDSAQRLTWQSEAGILIVYGRQKAYALRNM